MQTEPNRKKTANLFGYTDCYSRLFPQRLKRRKKKRRNEGKERIVYVHLNLTYNYVHNKTIYFFEWFLLNFADYNQSKLPLSMLVVWQKYGKKRRKYIQPTGMSLPLAQQPQSASHTPTHRPADWHTETATKKLFVWTFILSFFFLQHKNIELL